MEGARQPLVGWPGCRTSASAWVGPPRWTAKPHTDGQVRSCIHVDLASEVFAAVSGRPPRPRPRGDQPLCVAELMGAQRLAVDMYVTVLGVVHDFVDGPG